MAKDTKPTAVDQEAESTDTAAVYDVKELATYARRLFNCHPDIADAALRCAGMTQCTIDQAQTIVREFAERKVK